MKPKFLETNVKTETGSFDIEAGIRWIGDDLLVAIWGGEKPHIGAVAVAQSSTSLKNPEITSVTASVICFLAHKEDELAKAVSKVLAKALDTRVVVTAGIHWDNLSQDGIQKVIKNSEILTDLILEVAGPSGAEMKSYPAGSHGTDQRAPSQNQVDSTTPR